MSPIACFALLLAAVAAGAAEGPERMTADDLDRLHAPPPDARVAWGDDPLQFGELRLPEGPGPHPVAVVIHGGCWLAEYDVAHIGSLSAALADGGIAAWTLEYRRVGNPGGGWPGTFQDVARGADHLRALAREHPLDLERVIAVGHSAGGHLALWLAARQSFAGDGPFAAAEPLRLRGVLALAAAADLEMLHDRQACGHVVDRLMGGSPAEHPERYARGSAVRLVPLGVPQIVIHGRHDAFWSVPALAYVEAARAAGDDVRSVEAPDSGHFEMIDPTSSTWPLVRDAARELLGLAP